MPDAQQDDKLAQFRAPDAPQEQVPVVDDNTEAKPESGTPSPSDYGHQAPKPDEEPKPWRDPRRDFGKRQNERREAETSDGPQNIDVDALPAGVPLEGAPSEPPSPAAALAAQEPPKTYALTVNQKPISATKDELIRYAQITPEEADGLPESALVRLAQKQLAADDYLAQARETEKIARQAGRAPLQNQGDGNQPQPQESRPQPNAQPGIDRIALAEKLQLGDTEEAARALDEYEARVIERANQSQRQERQQEKLQERFEQAGWAFEAAMKAIPAELYANGTIAAVHSELAKEEMMTELGKLPGVMPERLLALRSNKGGIKTAYQEALAYGLAVAAPDEIFSRATAALSSLRGQSSAQQSPSALAARTEAKRGLINQPAPAGQPMPSQREASHERNHSDSIRQIKKARHQPVI